VGDIRFIWLVSGREKEGEERTPTIPGTPHFSEGGVGAETLTAEKGKKGGEKRRGKEKRDVQSL